MKRRAGSLALACAISVGVACGRGERPDLIYRVDDAARGWVVIVFDRPNAPPLPKVGDAYLIDVPSSGVLATSTKPMTGRGRDTFRARLPDGGEQPVPPERVRAHRTGARRTESASIEYEIFFLGTVAELTAAEPETAALDRAFATLR